MIDTIKCNIDSLSLHQVGNMTEQEGVYLSKSTLVIEDVATRIALLKYFTTPFKSGEYFSFTHSSDINLNEVYVYVSRIFAKPESLHLESILLAQYLYEQSIHPRIKGGEFYVVYFKDLIVNDKTTDAIGLFKSENKEVFLKIKTSNEEFGIESERGININKLDKGCLIFNFEKDKGYIVSIIDNVNRGAEAKYWADDFLHVKSRKDSYHMTQNVLSLYKNYITKELPKESTLTKAEQVALLNRSVEEVRNSDILDLNQLAQNIFSKPENIKSFNDYRIQYQEANNVEFENEFEVSGEVLKKRAKGTMNIIKLDKNFDIRIHTGDENIVRGYDDERKMYYYQLFFKEEK